MGKKCNSKIWNLNNKSWKESVWVVKAIIMTKVHVYSQGMIIKYVHVPVA
jgi:hypothetical protein